MTFADMQSYVLFRLRQRGPSFGGQPTNTPTDYDPPNLVKLALNLAYNEFLSMTQDAWPATIIANTTTTAGESGFSMVPPPPYTDAAGVSRANPCLLRLYEADYIQNAVTGAVPFTAGMTTNISIVSSNALKRFTGGYRDILGAQANIPTLAAQLLGVRALLIYPAFAVAGDWLQMRACPDPVGTDAYYGAAGYGGLPYPCSLGGAMTGPSDVPLIAPAFHMALVEHAVASLAQAADKNAQTQYSMVRFQSYVEEQLAAGVAYGEGDAEQRVEDGYYAGPHFW